MKYPDVIFATKKIGSNGISCLDYKNEDDDVKYIRADLVKLQLSNSDYAKSKNCANCSKLYQCNDPRRHSEWHCEKHDFA